MVELKRELLFDLRGKSYAVKFPAVKHFLNLEATRMTLTNGTYGQMVGSGLVTSSIAMDLVDMAATLSTLCPEVVKDLKVESILDLDLVDSMELLHEYKKQVDPWISSWLSLIRKPREVAGDETQG